MEWVDALFLFLAFIVGLALGAEITEKEIHQPEVKIYDAIGIEHFERLVEHYEKLIEMILGDNK